MTRDNMRSLAAKQAAETRKRNRLIAEARAALRKLDDRAAREVARDVLSAQASEAFGAACAMVDADPADSGWRHRFYPVSQAAGSLTSHIEQCVRDVEYRAQRQRAGRAKR